MATVILSEAKDLKIRDVVAGDPSPSARLRMTRTTLRSHRLPSSSHIALRSRRFEELTRFDFVIGHRGDGQIGILQLSGIGLDALPRPSQSRPECDKAHRLRQSLRGKRRIKSPARNDRHARASVAAKLEADRARFERVNLLNIDRAFEPAQHW